MVVVYLKREWIWNRIFSRNFFWVVCIFGNSIASPFLFAYIQLKAVKAMLQCQCLLMDSRKTAIVGHSSVSRYLYSTCYTDGFTKRSSSLALFATAICFLSLSVARIQIPFDLFFFTG